jgi:hypothetical protein
MLVPDLHFATQCLLVLKLEFLYAAPHPHAQETNIPNMEDVEKMGSATCEGAMNQTLMAKRYVVQTRSCGTIKIFTCQ